VADGDYVVTIPCKLEYEPRDIPKILAELAGGADICVGSRIASYNSVKLLIRILEE